MIETGTVKIDYKCNLKADELGYFYNASDKGKTHCYDFYNSANSSSMNEELHQKIEELRKPLRDLSIDQFRVDAINRVNKSLSENIYGMVKWEYKLKRPLASSKILWNWSITNRESGIYLKVQKKLRRENFKRKKAEAKRAKHSVPITIKYKDPWDYVIKKTVEADPVKGNEINNGGRINFNNINYEHSFQGAEFAFTGS